MSGSPIWRFFPQARIQEIFSSVVLYVRQDHVEVTNMKVFPPLVHRVTIHSSFAAKRICLQGQLVGLSKYYTPTKIKINWNTTKKSSFSGLTLPFIYLAFPSSSMYFWVSYFSSFVFSPLLFHKGIFIFDLIFKFNSFITQEMPPLN